MRKADDLRRWLTQCLPDYKSDPDRLLIFLDAGAIATRKGRNAAFEYRYTLTVLFCDFTGDTNSIVVPLLAWIERNQPELLQRADDQPIQFEAEILDTDSMDITFKLELTEAVIATRKSDGSGYDIRYPAPPKPEELVPGLDAQFRQGYGFTELLAGQDDGTPAP